MARLVEKVKTRMEKTDDNCTVVCFGPTGSGKSTLGFHVGDAYNNGVGVNVARVGFDPQTLAHAFKSAKDEKGAFVMHDEGNISKRDSMTQHNKDFLDLLMTIRSKNWFFWINNPSADYLDKALVLEDLVNFFVFIHAKQRRFYLFSKASMLELYKQEGNLKAETIRKAGKQYAIFDGYFYKYYGEDWDAYLEKKNARVDNKLDHYIEKYGNGKTYSGTEAAKVLGVHPETLYVKLKELVRDGVIPEETRGLGGWRLLEEHIDAIRTAWAA